MIDVKDINKKVKSMPRHLLPEVMDYIDFLLSKYGQGTIPDKESPFDFPGRAVCLTKRWRTLRSNCNTGLRDVYDWATKTDCSLRVTRIRDRGW